MYESYVGSIISAITLAIAFGIGFKGVLAPLMVMAIGIVVSIIGTFFVKAKEGGNPQKSLNRGNIWC